MKDTCFSEEKKREVSLAVVSLWDLVVTIVVYMRVCVCVCVVTHGNHRRSSPLHVSLFILQPFERLTETNDSASEMSSRPTHKQVEGGGKWDGEEGVKKKKHCNQEVFFCFVVGSVLLRNASELIFGQTGPSHLHGFCSTWKETSIKLCFIPEQPCWFLMFALMHLTLIQCCLICLSVFYHVCLSKSVLAKIITWIDSFSIAASFTTDVFKCISDSNTSHHRCSSSLPFPQILSRVIDS